MCVLLQFLGRDQRRRVGFGVGLTGVAGGLFLAPLLIALQWASPKQKAALSRRSYRQIRW
jgi:hypothetical protein